MTNPLKIVTNGILNENPTFVQCIGLCPTLAVSTSVMIDALLEAGADVNEKSEDGMTALMFAAKNISAVNRLLQNGADMGALLVVRDG